MTYSINFSTNAAQAIRDIQQINRSIGDLGRLGQNIQINVNTARLSGNIRETFRQLNTEIGRMETRLSRLQIGSRAFTQMNAAIGYRQGRVERGQMIGEPLRLRGQAQAFDQGSSVRLNKELQAAQIDASRLAPNTAPWIELQQQIGRINTQLRESGRLAETIQLRESLGAFAPGSLAALETQLTILKNSARNITPNTNEWREFNNQIQRTERGIQRINKKPLSAGQRMGAAGGAFLYGGGMGGGLGSAVGGIAGGLMGGVPGAFAGAAAGQIVDNALAGAAALAKQYSEVQKMQRGLAIASIDAKDFAESQKLVTSISQRLLVPLADATRYYSQLRINTKQYNLSAVETSQILEGTVSAVRATGGSLEDVDGAMRAVVQIFSKGGVQAEELRGQLGERFPGAVIKFAQANKMTFEELQDRLQAGTVGIAEFVAFAKANFTDYSEFSKKLATAPEYAGDRMKIALEQLQVAIGSILGNSGATFQDYFTGIIKSVTSFISENKVSFKQMLEDFTYITATIAKLFFELSKVVIKVMATIVKGVQWSAKQIKGALGMKDIVQVAADIKSYEERLKTEAPGKGRTMAENALALNKKKFVELGGQARLDQLEGKQTDLVFGGAGANMPLTRTAEDKNKKGVEAFEKLRDDLAKAYNDAEIERIKKRFDLQKQLQQDQFDIQEFGANRLQKQNLALIKALMAAEATRAETVRNAQLEVQKQSGKVAGGVTQYYTGDPRNAAYDKSHGTVKNYHDHLAFSTREAAVAAYEALKLAGIKVTEFQGHGKGITGLHSGEGSLHHQGLAFDVPGYQWGGSGAIGAREYAGSARVRQTLGMGGQVSAGKFRKVGGNEKRDIMAEANTAIAAQDSQQAAFDANILKSSSVMKAFAQYVAEAYNIPDLKLSNNLLEYRNNLVAQGMSSEEIDYQIRLYEIEQQRQDLLSNLPAAEDKAAVSIALRQAGLKTLTKATKEATIEEKRKNDETLRGLLAATQKEQANRLAIAQAISPDAEMRLQLEQANQGQSKESIDGLFKTEKAIAKAEELKTAFRGVADAIGNSFGQAFKGVVSGSMTAQQALAGFFQSVADSFLDMVAQMIAAWLKAMVIKGFMSIISAIIPAAGAAAGSGFNFPSTTGEGSNFSPDIGNTPEYSWGDSFKYVPSVDAKANGGIFAGGFRAFASGGVVSGPTLGLVGEGRYNEAVIPLPDGKSVPVDLGGANGGNQITSNIVVNVNSDGQSQSQQSGNGNAELGKKIEGAVKQVIVGELRPGGLLAGKK
jgi:tape measure domain-containing protein